MTKNLSHTKDNEYICNFCKYITNNKKDFNKHLMTLKHKNNENYNKNVPKFPLLFSCECGKKYNHRASLYNHKKKCNYKNININNDYDNTKDLDYKSMFLQIINENKELRKTITELIPKVGNNHKTINNINSNNKNKFNINVFLNEKCKDALSMDEFIDKIEVSMKNLLTTKEKGQTHCISNIIIENMNKLSLYERPLHCTDKKRETLYVKNNEWEKDDNKEYINKALKKVESKQLKNLNVWLEQHPNYMNIPNEQEEFAKLMSECGKSVDDGREKIIKKLCDNVYIEKEHDKAL